MKQFLCILLLLSFLMVSAQDKGLTGYWYGNASVAAGGSSNNYLVEMVLNQQNSRISGVLNYYFRNTFRSLKISGNYNSSSRELIIRNIPLTYHGSGQNMEVDCIMDLVATMRSAKTGSNLKGTFVGQEGYRYTCLDVDFNLKFNEEASNIDSVLQAIREYKEVNQVWTPSATDTLVSAVIIPRKVVNYVIEHQFKTRSTVVAQEIEVDGDSLSVDFYDNGEVDGDSISIFYNSKLISFNRILSTRSVHFDIALDNTLEVNEISMFADNLGSIPPNTALMMVYDGKKRHQIRMSSDLNSNAVLRIRRRKSP